MSDLQFNFDDHFQLGVFELMAQDSVFCDRACSMLKAEYFKNKYYAYFFETIFALRNELKALPSQLQLRNEIMKIAPDKRTEYLMILERIFKPSMSRDHNYIRSRLTQFVKKAVAWQINDYIVKNQMADPDKVYTEISKHVDKFNSVSFENVQCQTLANIPSIMQESSEHNSNLIPTFMPTMDRELGGGVPKGTLTVGLSGTNVGKSIWLMNWIYHLVVSGRKVFWVNLEGYKNQPMLRLSTRAVGATYGNVRFNRLNDIELQKLNTFTKNYSENLQVFHNSTFGFTIEDLVPIIRQKKEEFDFEFLAIDYGQILFSKKQFKELRHEQSYVHRGLSSIAGELDVAVATVAQGNRETQEKNQRGNGLIRMLDISECFEICRAAATVITLNRSDTDMEMDRARALLDKQRDGRTGIIEIMKTNFKSMAFYGHENEGLGLGYMATDEYIKTIGGTNG